MAGGARSNETLEEEPSALGHVDHAEQQVDRPEEREQQVFGKGVERIFPVHGPVIDHIDFIRTGRVRRAKLYYLRALRGKAARLKERDRPV